MKRYTCQLLVVLCLLACVIIVTSFFKFKDQVRVLQISEPAVVAFEARHGSDQDRTTTRHADIDGLPVEHQIPGDTELSRMDEPTLNQIYWRYINMLQILCKDIIRVGSLQDGGKEICVDPPYKPQQPCLVYSFGINYMFDFDRDIVSRFGCDVHCFDPSMKNDTHRVSNNIWFYKWGLGGSNHVNEKNWSIKTLDSIRRDLGHTNRTIDLLKIDIEGDEWVTIPQMISSGAIDDVRQISMETHFSTQHAHAGDYWGNVRPDKQLSALRQLYDFGFRTFMRERNMWSHTQWPGIRGFSTLVNEVSMIKPKR